MWKSHLLPILMVASLVILASDVAAEIYREDVPYNDVNEISDPQDEFSHLAVDVVIPNDIAGKRVNAAYLYLEISAERAEDGVHFGDLLCIGVSATCSNCENDELSTHSEYSIRPGLNRTVVLDVAGIIQDWFENPALEHQLAVFGCDPRGESYHIQVAEGHSAAGWVEIRYCDVR